LPTPAGSPTPAESENQVCWKSMLEKKGYFLELLENSRVLETSSGLSFRRN
jgi:hypothetical protein